MARILLVDFRDPYRHVDHRLVTRGEDGLPFKLNQTWHRMADVVRDMLAFRVTFLVSYAPGFRPLSAEEIAVFERVLAPYAHWGTSTPSEPFIVHLHKSMLGLVPEEERFRELGMLCQAWGDDGIAGPALRQHVFEAMSREWTLAFPAGCPKQAVMWALQLVFLLVRPQDVHRFQDVAQRRAS